jgi:hypothetical protein
MPGSMLRVCRRRHAAVPLELINKLCKQATGADRVVDHPAYMVETPLAVDALTELRRTSGTAGKGQQSRRSGATNA